MSHEAASCREKEGGNKNKTGISLKTDQWIRHQLLSKDTN